MQKVLERGKILVTLNTSEDGLAVIPFQTRLSAVADLST